MTLFSAIFLNNLAYDTMHRTSSPLFKCRTASLFRSVSDRDLNDLSAANSASRSLMSKSRTRVSRSSTSSATTSSSSPKP